MKEVPVSLRHLRRLTAFVLLVLAACSASALIITPDCNLRCYMTVDTAQCTTGRMGGSTCEVVQQCSSAIIDPDGAGPMPPVIMVSCNYSCAITYCVWV
jgi:hypothetical protein